MVVVIEIEFLKTQFIPVINLNSNTSLYFNINNYMYFLFFLVINLK